MRVAPEGGKIPYRCKENAHGKDPKQTNGAERQHQEREERETVEKSNCESGYVDPQSALTQMESN